MRTKPWRIFRVRSGALRNLQMRMEPQRIFTLRSSFGRILQMRKKLQRMFSAGLKESNIYFL